MGLFDGIKQIADTAGAVPSGGDPADVESQRHAKYHKRIVFVGGCFAALGVVLGLEAVSKPEPGQLGRLGGYCFPEISHGLRPAPVLKPVLITSVVVASDVKSGNDIRGIILAPIMYGAGGFFFGMAIMCLVAPRAFLTGPVGAPWMKLIGTKNVLVARIACLLFGLVVTLPLVGIGLLIAFAK
jgi:hypothetical protein